MKQAYFEQFKPHNSHLNTQLARVLMLGLLVLCGVILLKLALAIINGGGLNHVAGAWAAMAQDLANGSFYRPLHDEQMGYGGTRFFPLFFVLHAILIKLTGLPLMAGHLLSLMAAALLLGSFYKLLRNSNIDGSTALLFTLLLASPHSIQHGFETIRGDVLPLAFNTAGILLFLSSLDRRAKAILVALCFTLAFATKLTAVMGISAVFVWGILHGRRPEALRILLYTTLGYLITIALMQLVSSGRVAETFAACAAGGTSLKTLLGAPSNMLQSMMADDKLTALFLFWALFVLLIYTREAWRRLSTYYLAACLSVTLVLYGSPGIEANHLVDLAAAALWFIADSLKKQDSRNLGGSLKTALCVLLVSIIANLYNLNTEAHRASRNYYPYPAELVELLNKTDGKVVAEDPMLPLLAGRSPYVLDSFMLRILTQSGHKAGQLFVRQIKQQSFPLIVFMFNPLHKPHWYTNLHFGTQSYQAMLEYYQPVGRYGRFHVYGPRPQNGE